ncbi:MAG: glucosyltransferase domain-containing protein [Alphaproteobacteria bacterium]|nr:glucosyltransferase domain-containing protein [Alphaproteobacteria bacterium]
MKSLLKKLSLLPDSNIQKALLISFIIANFCFLYHTLNFMWGNHDVKFIKEELLLSSGLFEGRFTQFILYRLLTNGQILPVLNNLIGFSFLIIAMYVLSKYWNIPQTKLNLIIFTTFFITQPYTLSWLYFTFITISCMAWAFFAILGLYLSSLIKNHPHKLLLSIISIICFYLPLGGYPPIINTFFVCLSAKMTLDVIFYQKNIKDLFATYKYTIINILISAILFKLTLYFVPSDEVYNLETTPIQDLPNKFFSTLKISFNQFFVSVPFMEKGYKITLAIMSFISIFGAIITSTDTKKRLLSIVLICATIWFTSLTTFLVVPPTEYVSRIDFYGYGFLYAFFLSLLLSLKPKIFESIGILFGLILIYLNILNNYHALYVWQEGFKHETKILENIYTRIELHPNFNPEKKYRIFQVGDISLRPMYYNKNIDKDDVFLLSIPYLAMWQSKNLLQFYSPFNFTSDIENLFISDITDSVQDYVNNRARIWPEKDSIYIDDNIILIVLTQNELNKLKIKVNNLLNKT